MGVEMATGSSMLQEALRKAEGGGLADPPEAVRGGHPGTSRQPADSPA